MLDGAGRLRVVVEGGPLADGRATAGIGRYLRSLVAALDLIDEVDVRIASPGRPVRTERHPLRYLHAQPRVATLAARTRPDLVHAVASEPAIWPTRWQVVTVHDVIPWTSPDHARGSLGTAYFRIQAARLRRCRGIITVSRVVADRAIAALGLDPARVSVVPEGVDPVFSPGPGPDDARARAAAGVAARQYVLWAGTLFAHDPRKDLDTLVEAMGAVARTHPDLVLLLAGRPGPEADRVLARAREARVEALAAGFVPDADLAALYRGAAATVVPSRDEGFGLPALEAMSCGSPLVATRTGNIPDLVGDAAVLVEPRDPRALAGAISAVVSGDGAAELRGLGPRRASGFTWERTARETIAAYRRALGRSGV